jgi:hypothetical protein
VNFYRAAGGKAVGKSRVCVPGLNDFCPVNDRKAGENRCIGHPCIEAKLAISKEKTGVSTPLLQSPRAGWRP